jgi:hypothetical protein
MLFYHLDVTDIVVVIVVAVVTAATAALLLWKIVVGRST